MEICWEMPRLIEIGQKFGDLYNIIWARFIVRGKKIRYSCESLDILILFAVARGSTGHKERIVVFPYQKWLRERITSSGYTYGILSVFWQKNMSDRYRTAEETKIRVSPECGSICERECFSYFFFDVPILML
jgi:hypothetical protein